MQRRTPDFTFALCTSLVVHLLGLSAMAWWLVAHTPPPKLAAIDKWKVLTSQIAAPPRPIPPPPPPPRVKKKPPPTKFDQEKPQQMPKDDSGESDGKGTANRSTPGITPMQAPKGYEQADLTKDVPDDTLLDPSAPLPAAAGEKVGTNAPPKTSAPLGRYTPDFVKESQAQADADADTAKAVALQKGVGPLPLATAAQANVPAPSGSPQPIAKATPANQSQQTTPQAIRGHRAIASDSESVAFANADSVTLRDGKLQGRKGLKVTPKIPRFGLASEQDGEMLGEFHLVIGALADSDGTVIDVVILQSSGSTNIDRDYQNSVYTWTFEAPKDKDGHPLENKWTINIE